MTTYYQAAISGNRIKNKGSTILNAGNVNSALANNLTLATSSYRDGYGSKVPLAVSPTSSGNVGTAKAVSGNVFGRMEKGYYVGMVMGTRIGGVANTILASGAGDFARKQSLINVYYGDRRLHITSWAYATGAPTYGGSRGALVTFGADDAALPTNAVPGELQYMAGSVTPVQDNFKPRTNT